MTADNPSNGYEQIARQFMLARNPRIGATTVSDWSKVLPHGAHVLDLGCGHGIPVSDTLTNEGFKVYGVDASPTLVAAYHHRFPDAQIDCATVEESTFFDQTFDGIVAWGVMFLLTADTQVLVLRKVAKALKPGGRFLFVSPEQVCTWPDAMTGRDSVSLGTQRYREILEADGLNLDGEAFDEGDNHYFFTTKRAL